MEAMPPSSVTLPSSNKELLRYRALDQSRLCLIVGTLVFVFIPAGVPPPVLIPTTGLALLVGILSRRSARKSGIKPNGAGAVYAGMTLALLGLAVGVCDSCGSGRMLTKAKRVNALNMITSLEQACLAFSEDYHIAPSKTPLVTTDSSDGVSLLNALSGTEDSATPAINTHHKRFLAIREGKRIGNKGMNGMIYSENGASIAGLYDPWGTPFTILLDMDGDGVIRFNWGVKALVLNSRSVAVFSPGPDRLAGTDDDLKNW